MHDNPDQNFEKSGTAGFFKEILVFPKFYPTTILAIDGLKLILNSGVNPTTILAKQILISGVNPTTILVIDGLKLILNSGVNPTTILAIDGLKQSLNSGVNPTTILAIDG